MYVAVDETSGFERLVPGIYTLKLNIIEKSLLLTFNVGSLTRITYFPDS